MFKPTFPNTPFKLLPQKELIPTSKISSELSFPVSYVGLDLLFLACIIVRDV